MDEEMNQLQQEPEVKEQGGSITFANDVLATIAGIAACDIPGVAGMSGGFKDGIVELLGKKNFTKGIKITVKENAVTVDIQIVVDYGVSVPEVCKNIQDSVSKALETMTGLAVSAINISIQGVKFKELNAPGEEPAEEEKKEK